MQIKWTYDIAMCYWIWIYKPEEDLICLWIRLSLNEQQKGGGLDGYKKIGLEAWMNMYATEYVYIYIHVYGNLPMRELICKYVRVACIRTRKNDDVISCVSRRRSLQSVSSSLYSFSTLFLLIVIYLFKNSLYSTSLGWCDSKAKCWFLTYIAIPWIRESEKNWVL